MKDLESKERDSQKVVAAVIYSDDRESVLLGRRARSKPFAGRWEFIGGKVEFGESFEEAIKREVSEEIGLFVLPLSPLGEARFETQEVTINVTFIECEPKSSLAEIIRNPEIQSKVSWVRIKDLAKKKWVGANGEFAKWLVKFEENQSRAYIAETY